MTATRDGAPSRKTKKAASEAPAPRRGAAAGRKTGARAAAASAKTAGVPPAEEQPSPQGGEGLLRAGLKALGIGTVRDDVVKHKANVIESLLGMKPPAVPSPKLGDMLGLMGGGGFGLRSFEDVFDQRVAAALERLGCPGAAQWQALRDELAALRQEVQQLRAQAPAHAAAPVPRRAKR